MLVLLLLLLLLPAVCGGDVSVWPKPALLEGGASAELELAGPVAFRGPSSLSSLFVRYRRVIFRHGEPTGLAAVTIDVTVANSSAALGLRTNESYALSVHSATSISIKAPTQLGAIHALETLAQLVHWGPALGGGDGGYTVPGDLRVVDEPFFAHRELMVDCARFFLPLALLEDVIDAMVATKLNALHLHASDSESMPIVFKSRPDFAQIAFSSREMYTLRELAALAAFAAARGARSSTVVLLADD